jgi:hypothetical protein
MGGVGARAVLDRHHDGAHLLGENLIGYNMLGLRPGARQEGPVHRRGLPKDYNLVLSRVIFINKAGKNVNAAKLWVDSSPARPDHHRQ